MHSRQHVTRRQFAAGTGAAAAALALSGAAAAQGAVIRQGYQTNMWGMPTYYLLRSGALEKRGLEVRGVRRSIRQPHHAADGGAAGGPGHLRRPLLHSRPRQGRARRHRRHRARRPHHAHHGAQGPGAHQGRAVEGPESRQPDGLLGRQHLRRPDRAGGRPEERRLPGSAHGREQHGRRAWPPRPSTPWSTSSPTTPSPRPMGLPPRSWTTGASTRCPCSWPPRPSSWPRARTPSSPISRPGSTWRRDFKENPGKVADAIYGFYASKGYTMSQDTFRKALATVDVDPGFPVGPLGPTCRPRPRSCSRRRRSPPSRIGARRCAPTSWSGRGPGT